MFSKFALEQPISCKVLNNVFINKHFSHAYLFETNGYDKGYNMALTFAKVILCPYDFSKCSTCNQCKMIDENNYPELKIIDESDNWIKKENLINLQEEFNKKALLGNKKVYIINHAEKLNVSSSNSILKFLEEPQPGIIAILVVNNRYQLLDTIVSRCQIISLNGQTKEKYVGDFQTLKRIGQVLTNNENDYNAFCNDENKERINSIIKFVSYFEKNKLNTLLYTQKYFHKIFSDKRLVNIGLNMLLYFYKDVLNYKLNREIEIYSDYKENVVTIASLNNIDDLIHKINTINISIENLEYNANLNLLIDKMIMDLEV